MKVNAKNYGSTIHISTNGLKMKPNELFQLLNEAFDKYKN